MRISTTPNTTPQSTPPSSAGSRGGGDEPGGDGQLVWRMLVPRLVHPTRLQIVEVLIEQGRPMCAGELAALVPLVDGNTDLVRYHARAMTKAGTLEVVGAGQGQAEGRPEEPAFYFALPK